MNSESLEAKGISQATEDDYSKSVLIRDPVHFESNEDLEHKIKRLIGVSDAQNQKEESEEKTENNPKRIQAGIEFRIQCAALRSQEEQYDLIRKHNIREALIEEYHKGYYKYTVGSLASYEASKRWRNTFIQRTNLLSAFIVAYRDGIRLNHVNEARY